MILTVMKLRQELGRTYACAPKLTIEMNLMTLPSLSQTLRIQEILSTNLTEIHQFQTFLKRVILIRDYHELHSSKLELKMNWLSL